MTADPSQPSARRAEELAEPGYWLVAGLEWPGGSGLAEAAFAVAPEMIPRDGLGHDAYQVLGCSDLYARKHAFRVVFFSDLTRMFTKVGRSWSGLDVDWEAALRELGEGSYPAMFLTVSERAYLHICDAAADRVDDEREVVRQAVTDKLTVDWRGYINGLVKSGRISQAG